LREGFNRNKFNGRILGSRENSYITQQGYTMHDTTLKLLTKARVKPENIIYFRTHGQIVSHREAHMHPEHDWNMNDSFGLGVKTKRKFITISTRYQPRDILFNLLEDMQKLLLVGVQG